MGLQGWVAASAVTAGVPVVLAVAGDPSPEFARWAIGGLATAVVSLASFAWRQYERRNRAEIALAKAEVRLEAYGKSAPELAEEIRLLGEEFRDARDWAEAERSGRASPSLVWPYDRPRRHPDGPRRRRSP